MKHETWTKLLVVMWLILILVYFDLLPSTEGSLFKVIDNFSISKIQTLDNGILVHGNFDKIRNCEFNELRAFLTNKNGLTEELETSLQDAGIVREVGNHNFGPWFVQSSIGDFKNVTLTATHTCHPFWQTTTRLLPR